MSNCEEETSNHFHIHPWVETGGSILPKGKWETRRDALGRVHKSAKEVYRYTWWVAGGLSGGGRDSGMMALAGCC